MATANSVCAGIAAIGVVLAGLWVFALPLALTVTISLLATRRTARRSRA